MTADGTYSYTWNGENRLSTAAGVTYTYDGDGRRVKKSSGTIYWYGEGAVPLAETDLSGNTTNEYIFFAGARIARRDASGNVYYYFADHLGSSRTITNSAGALCYEADFYPFGGERVITNTCGQNYKFAGMERDSETGNDQTWFRYYASNLGRWLSPDPVAGDISNPQSLNRYAYVVNNPTNFTDPLGLHDQLPKGWECVPSDEDCQGVRPPRCNNMTCVWEYWRSTICSINGHWGPCPSWDWEIGKTDRGNDIFDALAGAPGTYLTLDIHGNVSFGFDEGLWMKTWMAIEMGREYQKSVANALGFQYDPNYIPTAGFFALRYSSPGGDWGLWTAPQEQKWNDPFQTFVDSLRVRGTLNVYQYPVLRVPVYSPPIT